MIKHVGDKQSAAALADRLNGAARTKPVVVVTLPAGGTSSWIDVGHLDEELGDLAEVYLMPTGEHSRTFSHQMPDGTQVYGGAGRVYSVGHDWVADVRRSPLRFAFNADEGRRATGLLVADALRMAADAGLFARGDSRHRRQVEVTIGPIFGPRAPLKVDGVLASIAQELTHPDVPLDRIVATGMTLPAWFDSETHWLDIRDAFLPADRALASYSAGAVVLSQVEEVLADRATLQLHPDVAVTVDRDQVTGNELDDLRTLLTPGEVVLARVVDGGPDWRLTMIDIDDDELPLPAAALIDGGPPWLVPPPEHEFVDWVEIPELDVPLPATPAEPELISTTVVVDEPVGGAVGGVAVDVNAPPPPRPGPVVRPTPHLLDKRRPAGDPAPPPRVETPAPTASRVDELTRRIGDLESTRARLASELDSARLQLAAARGDHNLLVQRSEQLQKQVDHLGRQTLNLKAQLRKTKTRPRAAPAAVPQFADPEAGFRYQVLTAWATRTPPAEQVTRPLGDYTLGPVFLDSLQQTAGTTLDKVADVVFEVVTERAHTLPARDLHQLRESAAGNAPTVRRADGATCWRASLQTNSPSARRLHFWRLPGGGVELSRVVLHDDFTP